MLVKLFDHLFNPDSVEGITRDQRGSQILLTSKRSFHVTLSPEETAKLLGIKVVSFATEEGGAGGQISETG